DNPFVDDVNKEQPRMYKTGDRVRYLPDGTIAFLSRLDDQVKLRGLRIELGEIEHQLERLNAVKTVVVMVREDQPGQQRLVAYVTVMEGDKHPEQDLTDDWRHELQLVLPNYMVPAAFVVLEQLPLLPNGKVNRNALPKVSVTDSNRAFVKPTTDSEKLLAKIWGELLQIDENKLSNEANYFESGGHSLVCIRRASAIRVEFGVDIAINDIFEHNRLTLLASHIDKVLSEGLAQGIPAQARPELVRINRDRQPLQLSFAQQRLWMIDQISGANSHYNISGALRITGEFNQDMAQQVLSLLVARHEPLRTVFIEHNGTPAQHIKPAAEFKLKVISTPVIEAINAEALHVFNLAEDLLFRASIIKIDEAQHAMIFNMHHITSDGWSLGVLMNEFIEVYQAISQGKPNPLNPLEIQYADYAKWQRDWLTPPVLQKQFDYWATQLAQLPPVHSLPIDKPRPKIMTNEGAAIEQSLDIETSVGLEKLAIANNATLFMVLHSAFALALSRHSNNRDIV
ncbi:MAG: condensation domain-containing protein, partial [Psychrosphaera sp.]|nr:condensation domain-containing protein [Psychrosphaera sp.]